MDNRPLLRCLDADSRRHVPDMTLEDAQQKAVDIGASHEIVVDVVADGVYSSSVLTCEKSGSSFKCWFGTPFGWTIGYCIGATSAEAIERARAAATDTGYHGYSGRAEGQSAD